MKKLWKADTVSTLTKLSFLLCLILTVHLVGRASAETSADGLWAGEIELGGVATSGNTKTKNFNTRLMVSNKSPKWDHKAIFTGFYTDGGSDDDTRIFTASVNSGYKLSKTSYLVAAFKYENDRLTGYDYRFNESIGYGRKLIDGDRVKLKIEAGPGGRHSRLNNGDQVDELILRAALNLGWKISKTATLTENFLTVSGDEGTVVESTTALKSNIIGALAMKFSFKVKWNSDPPNEVENTDTITSITLVYGFK